MPNLSNSTILWNHAGPLGAQHTAPLTRDVETDVVVVGAGVTGLLTAVHLLRGGLRVVVLEGGGIASGETQRSTAHLASAIDDGFVALERRHGGQAAQLAQQSHATAITTIEQLVAREHIACGFRRVDGWLFAGRGQSPELLQRELDAAQRAGLIDAEIHERVAHLRYDTGIALRFPQQAELDPFRLTLGLAARVVDGGGDIYTDSHVAEVHGGLAPRVVLAQGPQVRARAVVVATNAPINDRFAVHTKQAAYRTYVAAFRMRRGAVPHMLLWDTEQPYHYVRVVEGDAFEDILVVGGEDQKTGHTVAPGAAWHALEVWARERFPIERRVAHWSGQVIEPADGLAFIGKDPTDDNVYIATGDSGQGITHAAIAGLLLSALILGKDHPWRRLYDPARKPLSTLGRYAAMNLDSARGYAGYLQSASSVGVEHVPRGSGAVVHQGLAPVAVYCDPRGNRSSCSAVCPHLGAIVSWNADEGTWDCRAHGSRFDAYGHVLNGPANANLALAPEPLPDVPVSSVLIGDPVTVR